MAVLNTIQKKEVKRELTDKQQSFLKHLVETQGDAKQAAQLAGYSSPYHQIVKSLKSEILEITKEPGTLYNQRDKASYKSLPARDEATAAPMMMNMGIEAKVKSSKPENKVSGKNVMAIQPSLRTIKNNAVIPSANAMGMPVANNTRVRAKINAPMIKGFMLGFLAAHCRW